jgi:murein DD-endopeptidase MepM/ murein hydrolase activator NlpD
MKRSLSTPFYKWVLIPILLIFLTAAGFFLFRFWFGSSRNRKVISWIRNPQAHPEWMLKAGSRCKPSTPFAFPTDGFVGYLWDDSFRPGHRHQGIDIFSPDGSGETAVYSTFDGYLTRLPDWKSTLIIRIPDDPLYPGSQIWTYYTHMADGTGKSYITEDFPPGTYNLFIPEGTLLGYQGNYSGTPGNPTGIHLHFSIVKDDGSGSFLNELKIQNTLDPSPYFDLPLNGKSNLADIPVCPISSTN